VSTPLTDLIQYFSTAESRRDPDVHAPSTVQHAGMAAQPRRIVVGYDGSPAARRVLDAATGLTGYGSTLTVVAVAVEAGADDTALADARDHLPARHVPATYVRAVGDPADELIAAAREVDADLVVLGRRKSRERSGREDALGGAVLRRATCDVFVVTDRS
jgi:nucleotide-binding universal stress UspA family protein